VAYLEVQFGPANLKRVSLAQAPISIGRTAENDVVVNDPTVSGRHCRIVWEQGQYKLEDLGSTNGTFVNGLQVENAFLNPGDTITVGSARILFGDEASVSTGQEAKPGAGLAQPGVGVGRTVPPRFSIRRERHSFLASLWLALGGLIFAGLIWFMLRLLRG